jgi:NAD dependent epimerase/dehydratase family enzyme
MRRPAFMRAPAFALRIVFGEMADALLLTGQRAVPAKAERLGFTFKYPTVRVALESLFRRRSGHEDTTSTKTS